MSASVILHASSLLPQAVGGRAHTLRAPCAPWPASATGFKVAEHAEQQLKMGAETHPESVLPGTLEQLDHLQRSSLLQDDGDPAFLSFSRAVAFQLWSVEQLQLAREDFLALETSKLVKYPVFPLHSSKTTLKGNVTCALDKLTDSIPLRI